MWRADDAIALHCLPAHPGEEITEGASLRRALGGLGPGREPAARAEGAARAPARGLIAAFRARPPGEPTRRRIPGIACRQTGWLARDPAWCNGSPRSTPPSSGWRRPSAHMHVGWLATLLLPNGSDACSTGDELAERIAARLHLAPRFRQRVAPRRWASRSWVDDPGFPARSPCDGRDRRRGCDPARAGRDLAGELPLLAARPAHGRSGRSSSSRGWPTAGGARCSARSITRWSTGSRRSSWGCCSSTWRRTRRFPSPVDWEPEPAAGPLRTCGRCRRRRRG